MGEKGGDTWGKGQNLMFIGRNWWWTPWTFGGLRHAQTAKLLAECWICFFQSSLIHFQSGRPSKADAWYFPHLVFHRRIHFWRHFRCWLARLYIKNVQLKTQNQHTAILCKLLMLVVDPAFCGYRFIDDIDPYWRDGLYNYGQTPRLARACWPAFFVWAENVVNMRHVSIMVNLML